MDLCAACIPGQQATITLISLKGPSVGQILRVLDGGLCAFSPCGTLLALVVEEEKMFTDSDDSEPPERQEHAYLRVLDVSSWEQVSSRCAGPSLGLEGRPYSLGTDFRETPCLCGSLAQLSLSWRASGQLWLSSTVEHGDDLTWFAALLKW